MAQAIVHMDALEVAAEIIEAAMVFGITEEVAATLPVTWRQGVQLVNQPDPDARLLGYTLLLTALKETPGAAKALIEALILSLRGNPTVPAAARVAA